MLMVLLLLHFNLGKKTRRQSYLSKESIVTLSSVVVRLLLCNLMNKINSTIRKLFKKMLDRPVEVIGWITIALLSFKLLFNSSIFIFSTFLTRICYFRKINLQKCGPWAGKVQLSFLLNYCLTTNSDNI